MLSTIVSACGGSSDDDEVNIIADDPEITSQDDETGAEPPTVNDISSSTDEVVMNLGQVELLTAVNCQVPEIEETQVFAILGNPVENQLFQPFVVGSNGVTYDGLIPSENLAFITDTAGCQLLGLIDAETFQADNVVFEFGSTAGPLEWIDPFIFYEDGDVAGLLRSELFSSDVFPNTIAENGTIVGNLLPNSFVAAPRGDTTLEFEDNPGTFDNGETINQLVDEAQISEDGNFVFSAVIRDLITRDRGTVVATNLETMTSTEVASVETVARSFTTGNDPEGNPLTLFESVENFREVSWLLEGSDEEAVPLPEDERHTFNTAVPRSPGLTRAC